MSSDPSMMSVASWLPSASGFLRPQAGVFRDQDDLHHSTLGHLAQLIGLSAKRDYKRPKQVRVHGVNNEINRAVASVETFIQDLMSAIAELYNPNISAADQDPELNRAQQALSYLQSKLYKISALRKKFAQIRNSGKRNTLHTIGNIFSAMIQRGTNSRRNQAVVQHLADGQHKQIAKA